MVLRFCFEKFCKSLICNHNRIVFVAYSDGHAVATETRKIVRYFRRSLDETHRSLDETRRSLVKTRRWVFWRFFVFYIFIYLPFKQKCPYSTENG